MRVVLAVTGDTLARRLLRHLAALVARLAGDAAMTAAQREATAREVIEQRLFPVARGVALLALGAVVALVAVVLGMATDAGIRRFLVDLVDVATHARNLGVLARQCIFGGELVIEMRVGPSGFGMAIGAVRTEVAAMNVVLHVAGVTFGLGGVIRLVLVEVAVDAHGLGVLAEQREVAQVVIEVVGIEAKNVVVAALVLGVAGGAFGTGDGLLLAVKAAARCDVLRHVLVTLETQPVLQIARERRVARGAHCFRFGMRDGDRARHDEPFKRAHLCVGDARHAGTRNANDRTPPSLGSHEPTFRIESRRAPSVIVQEPCNRVSA
jgi:hypothetical protein